MTNIWWIKREAMGGNECFPFWSQNLKNVINQLYVLDNKQYKIL